jgi:hypothetical protein
VRVISSYRRSCTVHPVVLPFVIPFVDQHTVKSNFYESCSNVAWIRKGFLFYGAFSTRVFLWSFYWTILIIPSQYIHNVGLEGDDSPTGGSGWQANINCFSARLTFQCQKFLVLFCSFGFGLSPVPETHSIRYNIVHGTTRSGIDSWSRDPRIWNPIYTPHHARPSPTHHARSAAGLFGRLFNIEE